MGFELLYLHSAAGRLTATPPRCLGSVPLPIPSFISAARIEVCGRQWFAVFWRIKKFYAEFRRDFVTKSTSGGCSQFETYAEAIEPQFRTAFCERGQTDLRQIIG